MAKEKIENHYEWFSHITRYIHVFMYGNSTSVHVQ
jgi:hypothetical protein